MGERWNGLRLGDVVAKTTRTRTMIVTDLDLDDAGCVTCAFRTPGRFGKLIERCYRASALTLLIRAH